MSADGLRGPAAERDRITDTLVELIAEEGYGSLTLERLLRRAEVGEDGFRRSFESLEDCIGSVWEEVDIELGRRINTACDSQEEWTDQMRAALVATLGYLAADEGRARLYVSEGAYINEELRGRQQRAFDRLSSMIARGGGSEPGDNANRYVAEAVCGAIWHRVKQLLQNGQAGELTAEVPQFMYFAVLLYRGREAAEAELRRSD